MDFTPETEIYLCSTPLENDYKNQLTFSSRKAQQNYFKNVVITTLSTGNYTYQRKEGYIRADVNIEELYNCNYCMYQNSNFSDKWFYCFIVDMIYVNPNCTHIYIETDVWQTWGIDATIYDSFVVREHTNNDTIGANIVAENLDCGNEVVLNAVAVDDYNELCTVVVTATEPSQVEEAQTYTPGELKQNVFTALKFQPFQNTEEAINGLTTFINSYAAYSNLDAIVGIITIPWSIPNNLADKNYTPYTKFDSLHGYVPKNNKLFTYPYCFLNVTNCNGSIRTFRYELFKDPYNPTFQVTSSYNMESTITVTPVNYKTDINAVNSWPLFDESVVLNCSAPCAWVNDLFANWYGKKTVSSDYGSEFWSSGLMQSVVGGLTSLLGMSASGVANEVLSATELKARPLQLSGQTDGNYAMFQQKRCKFEYYQMCIPAEYARIIDNFFSMYGYRTNEVKQPNITGRKNWNYVETRNIIVQLDAPNDDVNKLKAMFNNGVTFWHNPDTFGDYSQDNGVS